MSTKTTDQLLQEATPRPWWRDDAGFIAGEGGTMLADFDCLTVNPEDRLDIDEREANKELAARAVNSFEAMRDGLKSAIELLDYAGIPRGYSTAEWVKIIEPIENALALAEGKEQ